MLDSKVSPVTRVALVITILILALSKLSVSAPVADNIRYVVDAKQSKFTAHGLRGGLLWFKGHEHLVAVKNFGGEAEITSGSILPAKLHIVAKAGSLEETSSVFTDQQKQIINKELREIVFQPDKYPEISFQSTSMAVDKISDAYKVKIKGDLTLHGVTRPITIPAKVSLSGNDLHAIGEFDIDRSDFNVKATSAFHGMVRVRKTVRLEFDIVAHRM